MTKVALRGIAARKLRAFTTWLAIFLGVALVAGTYVLTDTINESFSDIFSESLKGTDVAITARQDVQTDDAAPPGFPARLIDRVRKVDGVEAAAGSIFAVGRFVDSKGDPIGNSFAPNFIASLLPDRFETLEVVEGRAPRTRPRGHDRHADRRHRRPQGGRDACASPALTRRRPTRWWGSRSSATRASAAPASPSCSCPRRSGSPTARASSTRSRWRPRTA